MTENVTWHQGLVTRESRADVTGGLGITVWMTGLSGSGKSSIAAEAERFLITRGRASYVLDGDNLRFGINRDLGFSAADRTENVRRVGEIARLMADSGLVVLVPVISPYESDRENVRFLHQEAGLSFVEVFVDTPLAVCEQRDPKGLYAKARAGEITGMTGIDDPYEAPQHPELRLDGSRGSARQQAEILIGELAL